VSTVFVGANVYATLQAAVDAAVPGDIIGLFTNTTENVIVQPGFPLKITQCTLARITAADSTKPVITVNGNNPVIILGLDTLGGTIGFRITGNGHSLGSIRATSASTHGVALEGNGNSLTINRIENNGGAGVHISGDSNTVKGGTTSGNGVGMQIAATGSLNTINGPIVQLSLGDGFRVDGGPTNKLLSLKSNTNGGNGYALAGNQNSLVSCQGTGNGLAGVLVTGTGNIVRSNKLSSSGGCEYNVTGVGTTDNGGSNQKNGVNFTNIEALGCFE
jgi:hypothetical protein